jgi:hypothetical protein
MKKKKTPRPENRWEPEFNPKPLYTGMIVAFWFGLFVWLKFGIWQVWIPAGAAIVVLYRFAQKTQP